MTLSPHSFVFQVVPEVRFGRGRIDELGELLRDRGRRSVLVVTDPGLADASPVARARESLAAAGVEHATFSDVAPNPRVEQVGAALLQARDVGADAVVAVGGGSPMDVAKAVGVLLENDGPIGRYAGGVAVPRAPATVVAVPTTAGTGAEVTPFAVFSDPAGQDKFSVGHPHFAARVALVDPELTLSLPPAVTAATGMDALSHAVECYLARTGHPASEALALRAIALIADNLETATHRGDDLDAREAMLLGSLLAATAFISTRLGVMHAIAIPIGALTDLPHGLILAAALEPGLRFNQPAAPERCAHVAQVLGRDDGDAAAAVARLRDAVGLPARLGPLGLRPDMVEPIGQAAMRSPNLEANPREITPEALREVVEALV